MPLERLWGQQREASGSAPSVNARREGVPLAALQSFGQALAAGHCSGQSSPEEGFLRWAWRREGRVSARGPRQTRYSRMLQWSLSDVPQPEGPASNTEQPSPRWGHKLASQLTLKGACGGAKGPFPVAATGDRTEWIYRRHLLAKFRCPALLSPLLTEKQPPHRNLQPARVEKYTVGKPFLFGFLEALERPARKLQSYFVRLRWGLGRICSPEKGSPRRLEEGPFPPAQQPEEGC